MPAFTDLIEMNQDPQHPTCLTVTKMIGPFTKNNFQEFWRWVNERQYTTVILPEASCKDFIKYYSEFNNCMKEDREVTSYIIKFQGFLPITATDIMINLAPTSAATATNSDTELYMVTQAADNLSTLTVECDLRGTTLNPTAGE